MNFMSILSLIMTIVCIVWLIALGIFVFIKKMLQKKKAKTEINKVQKDLDEWSK